MLWYILVLGVVALGIAYVAYNYARIRKMPEGTREMAERYRAGGKDRRFH